MQADSIKIEENEANMLLKIKEEVNKQFDVIFLKIVKCPQWVTNIVLIPKKDENVWMCVDYRDLNRVSDRSEIYIYFTLPYLVFCCIYHIYLDINA